MQHEGRSMREQILAAAVALFAEYGYHAAPFITIFPISNPCLSKSWKPRWFV
jgi:hypothetical protein